MIACVGSFEPRKNHLTFLAAAEKLWLQGHDFELQLVGRTTDYYAPKMLPRYGGCNDEDGRCAGSGT
jgi:glycosyltransferase involved in cell wall biosynthesis